MIKPTKEELKIYNAYYEKDTAFSAFARLLQSKWRMKNFPANKTNSDNRYGNYLEMEFAKSTKANFLSAKIKSLITEKIVEIRRNGGLISEPRIWDNLLSSQPLCFNLFGELHSNPDLAKNYFNELFPDKIKKVTKVDFEYSSKRGLPDNSAFDVFIKYLNFKDKKCFIGIEVKYQESLKEESPRKAQEIFEKHQNDYIKLTNDSKAFKSNAIDKLKLVPLSQIWRDHLLTFNMRQHYEDGFFVFLYPFANDECQNGVDDYKKLLVSNDENETSFYPRSLEVFIKTLRKLNDTEVTRELEERYLGT
jgi:hypothetical protein